MYMCLMYTVYARHSMNYISSQQNSSGKCTHVYTCILCCFSFCIHCHQMKEELLRKLDVLSPHLPPNTLDELIDGLGGPSRVSIIHGTECCLH